LAASNLRFVPHIQLPIKMNCKFFDISFKVLTTEHPHNRF